MSSYFPQQNTSHEPSLEAPEALLTDRHTHASTYREMILEHHFISEILRHIWSSSHHPDLPEITHSQVDDNGYDVVIEWRGIVRHIQLKSTVSKDSAVKANTSLCRKPSGCIVLMTCKRDLGDVRYHWLGGRPPAPLTLPECRPAKHTRANRLGIKGQSISSVMLARKAFTPLGGIHELVERMFPSSAS